MNKMIAEYMILANEYVAEKIYRSLPTCKPWSWTLFSSLSYSPHACHSPCLALSLGALLRRHPPPRPTDFEALISAAAVAGFEMDVLSSKYVGARNGPPLVFSSLCHTTHQYAYIDFSVVRSERWPRPSTTQGRTATPPSTFCCVNWRQRRWRKQSTCSSLLQSCLPTLYSTPHSPSLLPALSLTHECWRSRYFSTGECEEDDFRHYGLAADFYTHFTYASFVLIL